ncbi:MAG: alpha/beta hydrolase [Acidimicrobiales bacterium]|jgi:pimeloyl-ACP methyl ester carboxylesterase
MEGRSLRRRFGVGTVVGCSVICLGLAGCSSATSDRPATSSTSTPAATTTSTTLAASSVSIVKAPVLVARTTDGTVGYRSVGAGPPLVLIMGYSGSMDSWEPSFVDALGRRHRVVIFDNAGIGRTSSLPAPLTVTAMAQQTAALIEALHLGPTDVIGWSLGGMIAQALTVLHPDLVRRLVLCATFPGNGKATFPSAAAIRELGRVASGNATGLLNLLFPANQERAERTFISQITEFPHFYVASAAVDTAQNAALASWLTGKETAGRHLGSISAPTLIGDGLEDRLVPTANDHELASVIVGSQLVLYPDAGHGFLFQDERTFLDRLDAFLGD